MFTLCIYKQFIELSFTKPFLEGNVFLQCTWNKYYLTNLSAESIQKINTSYDIADLIRVV